TAVLTSLGIAVFIILLRVLGLLQPLELFAYDLLMRLRPPEGQDPYITVVGITSGENISDQALSDLLEKLSQYDPQVIGLDVYRDIEIGSGPAGRNALVDSLRAYENVITTCLLTPDGDVKGSSPPDAEIPDERLGFTNLIPDSDNVIRRQFLYLEPPEKASCSIAYPLSLQLAFSYLESQSPPIASESSEQQYLKLDNTIFKTLSSRAGGYQTPGIGYISEGHQILLNYRSPDPQLGSFVTYADWQVMDENSPLFNPDDLKGRVVIIGYTSQEAAKNQEDLHSTPYSYNWLAKRQMPGVFIHAHMTSQILNAVLKGRPLLWSWPGWGECLWIGSWSLVGSGIVWLYRSASLWLATGTAVLALGGCCFMLLWQLGGWIPLIPPALGLILVILVMQNWQRFLQRFAIQIQLKQ
ncbi:MAG: CHASE2 domain-containing protein, partial [Cyanothece sp. SIO1E1]|nr:CHASE2 domain-containing protein [Cyanothece sp. SIO1E1]